MTLPGRVRINLDVALLHELGDLILSLNHQFFGRRLNDAVVALHDSNTPLGSWNRTTRTISISRALAFQQPWSVVIEVMKHEMAHQFIDEVMGVHDESAHGPAFRNLCHKLGIDASAAGLPRVARDGGSPSEGNVLRRIAKFLALAESPNQYEAELAMKQAQRLMLKHNIDAAAAAEARDFRYRHVGKPRARRDNHEQVLAGILARYFFVQVIWVSWYLPAEARSGHVLELCGTEANLEVAAHVHGFLLETGERLWRAHRQKMGICRDRERRRFLLGVMLGFREKLEGAQREHRKEGLVWQGDPRLQGYFASRHPRRSSGRTMTWQPTQAFQSGREAGRQVVLQKPVTGDHGQRGRLLT